MLIQILVSDYVGFIKKIMKLMQHKYHQLKILEVELRQEVCGSPPQGMYRIYNSVSFFLIQRFNDLILLLAFKVLVMLYNDIIKRLKSLRY